MKVTQEMLPPCFSECINWKAISHIMIHGKTTRLFICWSVNSNLMSSVTNSCLVNLYKTRILFNSIIYFLRLLSWYCVWNILVLSVERWSSFMLTWSELCHVECSVVIIYDLFSRLCSSLIVNSLIYFLPDTGVIICCSLNCARLSVPDRQSSVIIHWNLEECRTFAAFLGNDLYSKCLSAAQNILRHGGENKSSIFWYSSNKATKSGKRYNQKPMKAIGLYHKNSIVRFWHSLTCQNNKVVVGKWKYRHFGYSREEVHLNSYAPYSVEETVSLLLCCGCTLWVHAAHRQQSVGCKYTRLQLLEMSEVTDMLKKTSRTDTPPNSSFSPASETHSDENF